jgi:hypothetical protein
MMPAISTSRWRSRIFGMFLSTQFSDVFHVTLCLLSVPSNKEMNYPIYDALNNEDAEKLGMKKGTVMAICKYRHGKTTDALW